MVLRVVAEGLWIGCGEHAWPPALQKEDRADLLVLLLPHWILHQHSYHSSPLLTFSGTSHLTQGEVHWPNVPPLPTCHPSLTMSWKSPFACPDRPSALPAPSLN